MKTNETSEKAFERELSQYVERRGGMAVKLLSQFFKGLPDRMFLIPIGKVLFVEFKSTGKKPTPIQRWVHRKFAEIGFSVYVVDNPESYNLVTDIIDDIIKRTK